MYYLILSGDTHTQSKSVHAQYVSFSVTNHDVCFGHTKPEIIKNYSLYDYLEEFGMELIDTTEVDENGESIPVKRTIIERLASWNHGAFTYMTRKARWQNAEYYQDDVAQDMFNTISRQIGLYTIPYRTLYTLDSTGPQLSESHIKWASESAKAEYLRTVDSFEKYVNSKYPLLHFKMDRIG